MVTSTSKLKKATVLCLLICSAGLLLPGNSFAQAVIGSWQGGSDEGWIDWGNTLSITNPANATKYSFVSGAVNGYTKSLQIAQSGYAQNLAIKLEYLSGGNAAFLTNHLLSFTFSVPAASVSGSTAGYSQLFAVSINATGYGFHDQATTQFTSTGDTNNNSGWQPNFNFYSGAPARSQVVTLDYSNILASITATTNTGYIELIFSFNNGGGAPTNYFVNNVVLSGTGSAAGQVQSLVVDDFAPTGVSPGNPAGHDHYQSTNVYSAGQITNVYGNWIGTALQSLSWDAASDAGTNASSGSLKINANFSAANNQFIIWNQGSTNNFFALNVSAYTYTNFECDVRFAAGSASDAGTFGSPIFGHLRFGDRTSIYGQDWFGAVDVAASNTNWVHVSIPLNPITDPYLTNILGLIIGIDRNYYTLNLNGASTLWVDNIKFTGASTGGSPPPPAMKIQKANAGLRIFAGSAAQTYDREQLATVDQNQSWIGGTYPVVYSFTLLSAANYGGFQTHMFLVPINSALPNSPYNNEFIEYQASNNLWLQINGIATGGAGVTANISWKTNSPGANPNIVAVNITNSTAVGTWKVTFNSASAGTLTAPGASPVAFTIADPNVATHFANPVVAYFGLQPNSAEAYGAYEDYSQISVSGVAGAAINDNFAQDASIDPGWDITSSAQPTSLVLVAPGNPYWVNWTLPDDGFGLGVTPNMTNSQWKLPEFYNFYGDGLNVPVTVQEGLSRWALIPSTCLPTVDATQGGVPSPTAFFRLSNPKISP